jgi:hypothetical protein
MEKGDLVGCDRKHEEFLKTLKKNVEEKGLKIDIEV